MNKDKLDEKIMEAVRMEEGSMELSMMSKAKVWASVSRPSRFRIRFHLFYSALILALLLLLACLNFKEPNIDLEREGEKLKLLASNEKLRELNLILQSQVTENSEPLVSIKRDTVIIYEQTVKVERDTLVLQVPPRTLYVTDTVYIQQLVYPEQVPDSLPPEMVVEGEPKVTKVQYNFKNSNTKNSEKNQGRRLILKTYN